MRLQIFLELSAFPGIFLIHVFRRETDLEAGLNTAACQKRATVVESGDTNLTQNAKKSCAMQCNGVGQQWPTSNPWLHYCPETETLQCTVQNHSPLLARLKLSTAGQELFVNRTQPRVEGKWH